MLESSSKEAAAILSIFSNLLLVTLKLIAGFVTGSVSIISEAVHSGMDLIASGVAYLSVRRADRPADRSHAYGHGKLENISGLIEALLIFLAALFIIYEALEKVLSRGPIESLGIGIAVMGFSAVMNLCISLYLLKVARATDSMALEADAHHLLTDVYTCSGVLLGLFLIHLTRLTVLDPLIALGVALVIIKTAYQLTRKSMGVLMDGKLPDQEEDLVASIIQVHSTQAIGFHNLRTRKSGSHRHIDLHLVVEKDTHVEEAHRFCDHLEADIHAALPNTIVNIHIEPHTIPPEGRNDKEKIGEDEKKTDHEIHQNPPN